MGQQYAPRQGQQELAAATRHAVSVLRQLDLLPPGVAGGPAGLGRAWHVLRTVRTAQRRMAQAHMTLFGLEAKPSYELFNDNRYEQHWWSWSH